MRRTDIEKRIATNLVTEIQAVCSKDQIRTGMWGDTYEFNATNGGEIKVSETYSPMLKRWKVAHAGVEFRSFSRRENHRISMAIEGWVQRQNMSAAERKLLKLDQALHPNINEVEQAATELKTWVTE